MIKKPSLKQIRPFYEHLRQQAEKRKITKYLEVAATFSLIATFLFLAVTPTASAISALVGEIKSKELYSKKMRIKIESIIQAQESFSKAQEKYHLIESGFPTNPHFYQAAVNLTTLSKDSSVNLKELSFNINKKDSKSSKQKTISKDSNIESFQANLVINSQYPQALSLIKSLANNRRLIDISSIQFSRPGKDDELNLPSNYINVSLSTSLFYSPINEKN